MSGLLAECTSLWLCWWSGPTAALIGQAVGSSVSFSKWRHVRPVRLQLGPDCFPEALEASPYLSAHRGGWRSAPYSVQTWPQPAWEEPFLVGAHAGKECRWINQCSAEHWMLSRQLFNSCREFATAGFSVIGHICRCRTWHFIRFPSTLPLFMTMPPPFFFFFNPRQV